VPEPFQRYGRLAVVEVRAIRWVGVNTTRIADMHAFAIDVLGLRVAGQDGEDFVELATADGSKLELFGSHEAADGPWLFESNPVVAGFLVDDIQAAREELARAAGVELLGELRVLPDGYAWQHFRAPDGHVYELTADPTAVASAERARAGRQT
jgi:catechol 2,3-dioxygenase-like lactoylglutathione lyase family enzyme